MKKVEPRLVLLCDHCPKRNARKKSAPKYKPKKITPNKQAYTFIYVFKNIKTKWAEPLAHAESPLRVICIKKPSVPREKNMKMT